MRESSYWPLVYRLLSKMRADGMAPDPVSVMRQELAATMVNALWDLVATCESLFDMCTHRGAYPGYAYCGPTMRR